MLIKFVEKGQKKTVVFGCDFCHRVISDPSKAIFAWRVDRKTGAVLDGIIAVYHKDTCDAITLDNDNEEKPDRWLCEPLSRFPTALINGLGLTLESVQELLMECQPAE